MRMSLLLGLLVWSGGCATGVARIELRDPLGPPPAKVKSEAPRSRGSRLASNAAVETKTEPPAAPRVPEYSGPRVELGLLRVKDRRPDSTSVGVKKNTYGREMGKVDVQEGVVFLDEFTKHLRGCFSKAGYDLKSVTAAGADTRYPALIEVEIRSFWTEFMPGFFVVDAAANVQFEVRILEPRTQRERWADVFRGKGKESSGIGVTRSMFEQSLNTAYAEAMLALHKALMTSSVRAAIKR